MKNQKLLIVLTLLVLVILGTLTLFERKPSVGDPTSNGIGFWGKLNPFKTAKLMMSDGYTSIEGSDKNGNGVWDDVESKIIAKYDHDNNLEKAMFQLARAIQQTVIMENMNKENALESSTKVLRAFECIRSVDRENSSDVIDVESWVVSDEIKSKRYIKYNSLLSGEQPDLGNDDKYCDFEVEK